MTRKELMGRLIELQSQIDHQDILTITAFMDNEQLAAHVERYEQIIGRTA